MHDRSRADKLVQIARSASHSLIVIQDIPDPDAIASAQALKQLVAQVCGVESVVAHEGIVGRAENRGLLRYLGLRLARISRLNLSDFDLVSTVDTQPQFGNNALPAGAPCHVVIDHHRGDRPPTADLVDIRPTYGATSTILTEYLRLCDVPTDVPLATALLYGIKSDTQDLGRQSTPADTEAYMFLYPRADKAALSRIEHQRVPRAYFLSLHDALEHSRIYGRALICRAGDSFAPEITAELADLLMRLAEVEWVLCYGLCEDRMLVSLRTDSSRGSAHDLVRRILDGMGSGGGHQMIAGGQIALNHITAEEAGKILEGRFLESLNLGGTKPIPLVQTRNRGRRRQWSMVNW